MRRFRRPKGNPRPAPAPDETAAAGLVDVGRDNTGIIATGPAAVSVQYRAQHATVLPPEALLPPAHIDAPPNLTNLPPRTGMFVGRAGELARLAAAVTASAETVGMGVAVLAVHGLGGVGKSTLAAEYAVKYRRDFSVIWWVTADSPAGIDTGLAALAAALQPTVAALLPEEVLRERAMQWLASHDRWLIVLDNVTDPVHVQGLLARAPTGRFVITSRRATGWHHTATPVRLDVLTPSEASQLLAAILTHSRPSGPGQLDSADELCAELGHLPLAIDQAGAYIAETGTTPVSYLRLLADYPASMYQQTAEGGDAQRTIARIWRVTLDQLTDTPTAGQLLRVLAFYAPTGIPRSLLDGLASPEQLNTAIGRLAAYSMITTEGDDLLVHRLVQAVARTPDPDDPHRTPAALSEAQEQATSLLTSALPPAAVDPGGWSAWQALLPHVEVMAQHTAASTDTAETAALLTQAAAFLADQGTLIRATSLFERALAARSRLLGKKHPDTLVARNNLARAYQEAGDLGRAIPLFEGALKDHIRVLGKKHPDTLAARNNLAYAYHAAGDLGRAIPLFEATLQDRRRVLGEDHPDTLGSRNNLARAYQEAGDLGRAIPLFEGALKDHIRVLGKKHPDTLAARNNLAYAYHAAGDLGRAIPLFEATLQDRRRVLGEDHPDTLGSRNNLALAYVAAGHPRRAIPQHKATLTASIRVLGEDHPHTLTTRNNLARAYQEAGDLRRAIPLFEATLQDRRRVLGEDHPGTLTTRNNLALAYRDVGDLGRAIPLFEATVEDRRRVLGEDHPDTLTSRNCLANAYQDTGDLGRAIPLFEATLQDRRRVLGEDHPGTLGSRNNLALAYRDAGDLGRAIPLLEATLTACTRVLGEDHPLTVTVRGNLERPTG